MTRHRFFAPWLLVLPVVVAHLWLASMWPSDRLGWGAQAAARPARIDVAFVRELQPAPPPAAVPAEPRTRAFRGLRPTAAASSPDDRGPLVPEPLLLDASTPADAASAVAAPSASAPVAGLSELRPLPPLPPLPPMIPTAPPEVPPTAATPVASQPPSPTFEWPPSTRLSYVLTGHYRGPVDGQAQVEWRLAGQRYQVALELSIGPPMAPFVTRQLLSDGAITAAGLEPRRYDEETHIVLRAPRRLTIALEPDRVVLPSGRLAPRPAGLQDSASQFVQMTWMFTMQPSLLVPGQRLQLPLALPRHVEEWTYEVVGPERLQTPLGEIEAVHVRPLPPPRVAGRGSADLTAEFWVAPTLQYLPVRIFIRQDDETFVDLMLRRLPQQAATGIAPAPLTTR